MPTDILVFVPGTLGSELWDDDDKVWPGSVWEAVKGFSDERFEQLRTPDLVPRDIVRTAAGGLIGVYSKWIEAFESIARDGKRPWYSSRSATTDATAPGARIQKNSGDPSRGVT